MIRDKLEAKTGKKYYVQGMHCPSCEILVEQTVADYARGIRAEASLKDSCVFVSSKKEFTDTDIIGINISLAEYGYTLFKEKPQVEKLDETTVFKGIVLFLLIFTLFLFVEKSGFIIGSDVSSTSSFVGYFIFGIAAGLSSCAALVGGIVISLSRKWTEVYGANPKKSLMPFVQFNIGRLVSFGVLGSLLGLIGSTFKISVETTAILILLVSLVMIATSLQMLGFRFARKFTLPTPKLFSRFVSDDFKLNSRFIPFGLGALTFFIPCGFTVVAQTSALATGSFVKSGLSMLAFALGTLPVLAVISFTSAKFYSNKSLSRTFSLVAGLLLLFFAIYSINSQLNVLGFLSLSDVRNALTTRTKPSANPKPTTQLQIVKMVGEDFDYKPGSIALTAGIPARIEFDNKGLTGCASVMSLRGLYPGFVKLKPGINTIDFTPKTPGKYKITCSMGMVSPVIVTVN